MSHKRQHIFTGNTDHDFTGLISGELLQFDGANILSGGVLPADTNLANTNLTLDAARTHQLDGNNLSFSGGNLHVAGGGDFDLTGGGAIMSGGTDLYSIFTSGASGTVNKFAASSAFTASVALQIDHNLGSTDVIVQLQDSTGELVIPDTVDNYQTNSVDITVNTTATYRAIITG